MTSLENTLPTTEQTRFRQAVQCRTCLNPGNSALKCTLRTHSPICHCRAHTLELFQYNLLNRSTVPVRNIEQQSTQPQTSGRPAHRDRDRPRDREKYKDDNCDWEDDYDRDDDYRHADDYCRGNDYRRGNNYRRNDNYRRHHDYDRDDDYCLHDYRNNH